DCPIPHPEYNSGQISDVRPARDAISIPIDRREFLRLGLLAASAQLAHCGAGTLLHKRCRTQHLRKSQLAQTPTGRGQWLATCLSLPQLEIADPDYSRDHSPVHCFLASCYWHLLRPMANPSKSS